MRPIAIVVAAALLAALAPAVARADAITLDAPITGAMLHQAGVDMAVYFTLLDDGAYGVVATYRARREPGATGRLLMAMQDGDAVRFALPDLPGALYGFARAGDVVTVEAEAVGARLGQLR